MAGRITYIFPSKSRDKKFFDAINNIELLSATDNYEIIAVLDNDDPSMQHDNIKERLGGYKNITVCYGDSTGKINAINREISKISEDTDIIIVMSDDMSFTQWGFDDIIRVDMQQNFPDLSGVIHYPDGSQVQDRVITLSILGYNYLQKFGYLYNPEYTSLWADMEFTEVAKKLNKYVYRKMTKIFVHNHSLWIKEKYDDLMVRNESYYYSDQKIYIKRQEKNFDL